MQSLCKGSWLRLRLHVLQGSLLLPRPATMKLGKMLFALFCALFMVLGAVAPAIDDSTAQEKVRLPLCRRRRWPMSLCVLNSQPMMLRPACAPLVPRCRRHRTPYRPLQ